MEDSKVYKGEIVLAESLCENEDFNELIACKWHVDSDEYIRNSIGVKMHQMVMQLRGKEVPKGYVIHHRNHLKYDNRYSNLEIVLVLQNGQSKLKQIKSNSRYYGVALNGKKYKAQVTIEGVWHYIGTFEKEIDAAEAYDRFIVHKGSFHELNRPDLKNQYKSEPLVYPKIKQTKSDYIGIMPYETGFRAGITINRKFHSKCFATEREAAKQYDKFIIDHGLNRRLNFPEEHLTYKPTEIIKTTIVKDFEDGTIQISLKSRPDFVLIIEKTDYDKIKCHNITVDADNRPKLKVDGKSWLLYRYLRGETDPDNFVDHVNSTPLDNSAKNLRTSDAQQNPTNQKKRENASSKYRGVYYKKANQAWIVEITEYKKRVVCKQHSCEENAARHHDLYVLSIKGSHRPKNFNDWDENTIAFWKDKLNL